MRRPARAPAHRKLPWLGCTIVHESSVVPLMLSICSHERCVALTAVTRDHDQR